jgi:Dcp2, box A domain
MIIPEAYHTDLNYICWTVEQAHYNYLDVLVPNESLNLRRCNLHVFAKQLFAYCLDSESQHEVSEYNIQYKLKLKFNVMTKNLISFS